ncbi:hypothetical protein TrCOL_g13773, partial [Triparma columacea]
SYGLILLTIRFLQSLTPSLAASSSLPSSSHPNYHDLGSLLLGFLSFYGDSFDPSRIGVSVGRNIYFERRRGGNWVGSGERRHSFHLKNYTPIPPPHPPLSHHHESSPSALAPSSPTPPSPHSAKAISSRELIQQNTPHPPSTPASDHDDASSVVTTKSFSSDFGARSGPRHSKKPVQGVMSMSLTRSGSWRGGESWGITMSPQLRGTGGVFQPRRAQQSHTYSRYDLDPICCEDPLNPSNNVLRNAFRIHNVLRAFSDAGRGARAMLELTEGRGETVLGGMLGTELSRESEQ